MIKKDGIRVEKTSVSKATLGRLPRYLQFLKELPLEGNVHVSSTAVARGLDLGEVQVRKDLSAVSGAGKPKVGYVTVDLIKRIESFLGYDNLTSGVIVGAGKLGKALLEYEGFENFGVKIICAFDNNPSVINPENRIFAMNEFEDFCKDPNIKIGIITVSEDSAQSVCDLMVKNGITAIWNFAPHKLSVPDGIILKQENLALSLAHLNNQLCSSLK